MMEALGEGLLKCIIMLIKFCLLKFSFLFLAGNFWEKKKG